MSTKNTATCAYNVMRPDGLRVGTVNYTEWSGGRIGWLFFPHFQAQRSRKLWPTPEAAIKGRADGCALKASS